MKVKTTQAIPREMFIFFKNQQLSLGMKLMGRMVTLIVIKTTMVLLTGMATVFSGDWASEIQVD